MPSCCMLTVRQHSSRMHAAGISLVHKAASRGKAGRLACLPPAMHLWPLLLAWHVRQLGSSFDKQCSADSMSRQADLMQSLLGCMAASFRCPQYRVPDLSPSCAPEQALVQLRKHGVHVASNAEYCRATLAVRPVLQTCCGPSSA